MKRLSLIFATLLIVAGLPPGQTARLQVIHNAADPAVDSVDVYLDGALLHQTPPNFELTPHRDGQWYKYFTSQFDQMWDAAKPWAPKVTVEQLSQGNGHLSPEVLYGNLSASNFFLPNKGISNDTFRSANTIYISGMTLNRTSREYMHILEERLTAGANVRIMILDTNKPLMQELVRRSAGKTTPEYWKNKIQTVETLLRVIAKNPNQNGKLELGHLPYIPSFGMVII